MSSSEKLVTVWVDKYVRGWKGGSEPPPGWFASVSLEEALQTVYDTDVHVVLYWLERLVDGDWQVVLKCPRMTIGAIESMQANGGRLRFAYGFADIDCADAHRDGSEASEEWIAEQVVIIEQTVPGCWWYATRGGMRVIWSWDEVVDHEEHSRRLRVALTVLQQAGLPVDELVDWGRCFRVPFGMREGVQQNRQVSFPAGGPAVWTPMPLPTSLSDSLSGNQDPEAFPQQSSPWDTLEKLPEKFSLPSKIDEGTRHNTLKRYAASLRARNKEREEIEQALREYEARAGADLRPYQGTPEGEKDLLDIVDWVCSLPAGPSTPPRPASSVVEKGGVLGDLPPDAFDEPYDRGDSVELAEWALRVIERNGVRCVYDLGEVWLYVETLGRYCVLPKGELAKLIASTSGKLVKGRVNKDGSRQYSKLKLADSTVNDIVRMIHKLRGQSEFFAACEGVAFSDCFVRVTAKGVEKHPHSPSWRCNMGYDEPWTDAEPTRWLTFLDEVLAGLSPSDLAIEKQAIAEWCGAMLTRKTTVYQVAIMVAGEGGNGKSQFVFVIEGLVPKDRITHYAPQHLSSDYNRAKLAKALLNSTTEVPSTEISETASAVVKALISGDPMTARFPYEHPFDFTPDAAVLLACNRLPLVRDFSKGFWRRIRVVQFNAEFTGSARVRDVGKSILEAERVQIVCWALRHLPALIARGEYCETQAGIAAKEAWRTAGDDVEQWLNEQVEVVTTGGTPCDPLYSSYRIWADGSGISSGAILSKRQFFDRLKAKHKPFKNGPATQRRTEYPLIIKSVDMAH